VRSLAAAIASAAKPGAFATERDAVVTLGVERDAGVTFAARSSVELSW